VCLPVFATSSSWLHAWFGPPDAVLGRVTSYPRGWIEATETRNRTPQLDTSAIGNPSIRPQPGRKGKRVPGVRHRPEYFRRRSPGCGPALSAALGAGFTRNPQRASSHRRCPSQVFPYGARPSRADHSRRGLPLDWIEVLPSFTESHVRAPAQPKESCFFGVKMFSYAQTQL
jgi:hypothetical protein